MGHEILLIIYLIILGVQIYWLVKLRGQTRMAKWLPLIAFDIGSMLLAFGLMVYFNELPGYMMSTFGHTLWSMGASAVYGVMTVVTGIICITRKQRKS